MSLTFECVRTVLTALPAHGAAVSLAIGKVKEFLAASDDPNLRYLGLLALGMLGPAYASTVNESRDVIALSLGDADSNIRREALHLMMGMVDENNVMDIAGMLVSHAARSDPEFANDILGAVLAACGRNVYELVSDFDWYVSLLADMARSLHCVQGDEIGRQLVDVGLRVHDARPELVRSARSLLIDPALLGNNLLCSVLSAAAWVSGTAKNDPFSNKSIVYMINLVETTVGPLVESKEVEVLERARNLMGFVHLLREIWELKERKVSDHNKHNRVMELINSMQTVFSQELRPVSVNAQKKISLPEDLVLHENLSELADILSEDDTTLSTSISFISRNCHSVETRDEPAVVSVDSSSLFEHRKRHGMYYLPTGKAEDDANNYPRANDPLLSVENASAMEDKSETVQPVSAGKKLKAMRSRPKVVKLDGEDFLSSMMTSANILKAADKSEGMGKKMDTGESSSQWIQNIYADTGSLSTSSSRTSKQHDLTKEKSTPPDIDRKEARKHKTSSRSGHRQGKHTHRERPSTQPDVAPQAPVVQDFLL
ncbi:AP-3 complex subunit delta [Triticum urartu]|uniref:Clathrin/coatomer adaptor adaptin-like N-terminal domain-containing protein n=2 Tax=Triticum TaxID=4564 RepID=A0A9R0QB48_TRITD|nr:AP-3 complex subunit delta [Triticum urartu]VAH06165.1 unnamed protein product [Triticum turgidum subsp. durum]